MASYWEDLKNGEFGVRGKQGLTSNTPLAALGYGRNPSAAGNPGQQTPDNPAEQSALSKTLLGTEGHLKTLPYVDPKVQDILSRLGPQVEQRLTQNLAGGGFGPIRNQAMKNFAQQRQGIGERLNALSGGEQRGQAAEHYFDSLSSDLESQLAAHEAQYNLAEGNQLQNILGQLMQPRNENLYIPRQQGAIEQLVPHIFDILTKAGLSYAIPAVASYFGIEVPTTTEEKD